MTHIERKNMTISAESLISAQQLQDLLKDDTANIRLLDASFTLPGQDPAAAESYTVKHIPGAEFFDIKSVACQKSQYPHMVPSPEEFSEFMSKMGIKNDDHIIIYGQNNLAMGPCRAFWMFKLFGHEKVSLLNVSLQYWEATGFPVTDDNTLTDYKKKPAAYKAIIQQDMLALIDEVKSSINKDSINILDARPQERFCGQSPEPRPGLRAGHIPGSQNYPAGSLISPQTGGFKPLEDIANILDCFCHRDNCQYIISCGSGVTACVIWLGLKLCGCECAKVYDGSWSEWGSDHLDTEVAKSA